MRNNRVNQPQRIFMLTAGLYLGVLLLIVAYGALTFRGLYLQPSRSGNLSEDALIKTFELQYGEAYDDYDRFLRISGVTLAAYLAIWTGMFGVWRKHYWQGIAALAAGGAVTVLALSLLPWMYFPLDQYAAAALWIMGSIIPLGISWILATVLGRALRGSPAPS